MAGRHLETIMIDTNISTQFNICARGHFIDEIVTIITDAGFVRGSADSPGFTAELIRNEESARHEFRIVLTSDESSHESDVIRLVGTLARHEIRPMVSNEVWDARPKEWSRNDIVTILTDAGFSEVTRTDPGYLIVVPCHSQPEMWIQWDGPYSDQVTETIMMAGVLTLAGIPIHRTCINMIVLYWG
jgi:hypothetical protein